MFGHKLCAAEKDPIIVGIDTSNTLLHESCALPHAKKSYGEICGLTGHLALSGAVLRALLETTVPGHRPRKDNAATDAISGAQRVGTRRVS